MDILLVIDINYHPLILDSKLVASLLALALQVISWVSAFSTLKMALKKEYKK